MCVEFGRSTVTLDMKFWVGGLRREPPAVALPIERGGARILRVVGREVFSAYVPGPRGPTFMTLLERTFGEEITTRTRDTVANWRGDPAPP